MIKFRYFSIESPNNCQSRKLFWGAAIGAIGSVVGGLLGNKGASKKQQRDQDFQREMWQKQVEQQDKVNQQAMAYQDKVNAENRAWSNESNVRQRVEDAGYNPYLYNGQASANSVGAGNATSLGNSVTAPATNTSENVYGPMAEQLSSVGSTVGLGIENAIKAYNFQRQRKIDKLNDEKQGIQGGTESEQTQAALLTSKNEARVKAATARIEEMNADMMQLQAYDTNGMPMVDESSGRPVTLAEQRARGENKKLFKELDKLQTDILKGQVDIDNVDVDRLLKKYQLTYLNPEQLAILRQTFLNLKADNQKINAETSVQYSLLGVNQSQAALNRQNVETQKNYARLLGQQSLTEIEKTGIARLENMFGASEKTVELLSKMRPSNAYELAHYIGTMSKTVYEKLFGKADYQSMSSMEQVVSKMLRLAHEDKAKQERINKSMSKRK